MEDSKRKVVRVNRPTVKDVAQRAGVAPSTVSNVLHGHPHVTTRTRARVEAAIAEIDYRPSLTGRQLRRGRTGVLALAIPDIRSPYFADLAHAVILEARLRGFTVLLDETGGDRRRELEIATGYPSRGIEGVFFCPVAVSSEELEQARSDVPLILLGEYVVGDAFDHVAIDSLASADQLAEHLIVQGRSRIAFAGHEAARGESPGHLRREGVRRALERHGLALADDLVFSTSAHSREAGEQVAEALAKQRPTADALVCAADLVAVGALRGFRRHCVRVPRDVAVAAWDDSSEGRYTYPALTTVAHDLGALATVALGLMEDRFAEPDRRPVSHVVPHRLVVRESSQVD